MSFLCWSRHKPPITAESILAVHGVRTAAWPKRLERNFNCVAFPAYRTGDDPVGWILYRTDGADFPQYGKVAQRKTHMLRDSRDGWVFFGNGSRDTLKSADVVWKTEGIPDAISLLPHLPANHVVTTNIAGALGAKNLPMSQFKGKDIRVVGDVDRAGREGATAFAAAVSKTADEVRLVRLPFEIQENHGKDLRDFFNEGHTFDELLKLADDTPQWQSAAAVTPAAAAGSTDDEDLLANAIKPPGDGAAIPIPMPDILSRISERTDDWPRRVGSALFIHQQGSPIAWLEKPASLFGWIGTTTGHPPWFTTESGFHTKQEVYSELQRTATNYEAVEELPHEPKLQHHYYACSFPDPGDGSKLRGLADRFSPETTIDTDLITALFVTVFWGGTGGTKPAFLITAEAGRGVGKSTLAAMAGYLGNGHIELSANENAEVLKQRLLSPEGITRRLALLDNVKSLRFSWAELESMITAPVISGKRMYVGESQRPNNLVWVVTLNGASLATDLSQRCVIVKLRKPKHSGNWLEETRDYIDDNRQEIIGDILGFLRSERVELRQSSRWGTWERDVLSRLPEPEEAQAVILDRQGEADVEYEESEIIEQAFRERLETLTYDADHERVFLPSVLVAHWLGDAMNDRIGTTAASRRLRQKIGESELKQLAVNKCNTYGRGFVWIGPDAEPDTPIRTDVESRIETLNRK